MNKIGKKISELRISKGLSQPDVATRLTQLGESTNSQKISKWETDYSVPSAYQFLSLCETLNIRDVLDTFEINKNPLAKLNDEGKRKAEEYIHLLLVSGMYNVEDSRIIPVIRYLKLFDLPVSAGTGQFLDSDSYELIEVGEEVPALADFGVKITGDSMEPRFVTGQIVWIHRQNILSDGEIGIFGFDNNAYCKKLSLTTDATKLISLNEIYSPIEIPKDAGLNVFGKVIG